MEARNDDEIRQGIKLARSALKGGSEEIAEYLLGTDATSGFTEKPVSSACAASMHPVCLDWDLCGCTVCHKICGNPDCRLKCRTVYILEALGTEVCSTCYRAMAPPPGRTTACESCGHHSAYRHPGTGDDRFLCPGCHVTAGHPRKQDRDEN